MRRGIIAVVYVIALLGLAVGCNQFEPIKPAPEPCLGGVECIAMETVQDTKCQRPFGWSSGNMIRARNTNPRDDLLLSYREIGRHINSTLPNEVSNKDVPVSKNGGVSTIGCEVTGSEPEHYVIWSYTKLSACVIGGGGCVPSKPTPISPPREYRAQSCQAECAQGGKFCLSGQFSASNTDEKDMSDGFRDLSLNLISSNKPRAINIDKIASAISNMSKTSCSYGPIVIGQNNEVSSSGTECAFALRTLNPEVDTVDVHMPSAFEGVLATSTNEFEIKSPGRNKAISLKLHYADPAPGEADDWVERIRGTNKDIMFESAQTYCLRMKFVE